MRAALRTTVLPFRSSAGNVAWWLTGMPIVALSAIASVVLVLVAVLGLFRTVMAWVSPAHSNLTRGRFSGRVDDVNTDTPEGTETPLSPANDEDEDDER